MRRRIRGLMGRQEQEPCPVILDAGESLEKALQALIGGASGSLPSGSTDTPDLREKLLSFAETYGACPFTVGQWVTRRENCGGHGAGWPHLVVEVAHEPHRYFYLNGSVTPDRDPDYGARYDIRVLHQNKDGDVHAHWAESWCFEAIVEFAEVEGAEQ